jgi:hypothetical protein
MSDPQFPLVNGTMHEWSSITLKANGKTYTRVKSINYSEKLTPTKVYGTSADAIGRTRGMREADGDLELYLDELRLIMEDLGAGFYETPFEITVAYSEDNVSTMVDTLVAARIQELGASQSQGADALTRKVGLNILKVLWNGVDGVKNPLTGVTAGV